jgi:hypothetical protein
LDMSVRYVFEALENLLLCPAVDRAGCDSGAVQDHLRRQRVDWFQLSTGMTMGLGRGFQLSVSIPVQLQVIGTRYETFPGADPYEPTYDGAVEPTMVRGGFNDGQVMAWYYNRQGIWTIGAGLGHSLPLAQVPDSPFGQDSVLASHAFRSGTGTVVPAASFVAVASKGRWGGWLNARASVPVIETPAGYRAPWSVGLSMGPSIRPIRDLQLLLTLDPTVEGRSRWDDRVLGGRYSLMTTLDVLGMVSPSLVLQGRVGVTVWEQSWIAGELAVGPAAIASVGVSWTARRKHRHQEDEEVSPDEP